MRSMGRAPGRGQYARGCSGVERFATQRARLLGATRLAHLGGHDSVSEVVRLAGVSRNTFYECFDDFAHALDRARREAFARLVTALRVHLASNCGAAVDATGARTGEGLVAVSGGTPRVVRGHCERERGHGRGADHGEGERGHGSGDGARDRRQFDDSGVRGLCEAWVGIARLEPEAMLCALEVGDAARLFSEQVVALWRRNEDAVRAELEANAELDGNAEFDVRGEGDQGAAHEDRDVLSDVTELIGLCASEIAGAIASAALSSAKRESAERQGASAEGEAGPKSVRESSAQTTRRGAGAIAAASAGTRGATAEGARAGTAPRGDRLHVRLAPRSAAAGYELLMSTLVRLLR